MWLDEFRARVGTHPGRIAVVAQGQRITYRDLWKLSAAAAERRSREVPGPRHLIAEADPLACLAGVIGAWIHGKVPVVLAPDLPVDVRRRIQDTIAHDPPAPQNPERREAIVMGTSGSTGFPKLAVLPLSCVTPGMQAISQWYGLPEESQVLLAVPLYATSPLLSGALVGLYSGWTLHLFPPGAPGSVLLAHIRSQDIAVLAGSPSFFSLMLRYSAGSSLPSVRHVSMAGERASRAVLQQMETAFPAARVSVVYGMSEAWRISALETRDPRAGDGGCGIPLAQIEARIVPVPGIAPPAGELWVRGAAVMLGYLQEHGSYGGLDAEGFLHTGDLARADEEGCLYPLGRTGGVVKVGGQTVYPEEVARVLAELPGVAEALCWAEPHELLGYVVAAMVVPQPDATLDERTLRRECGMRLEKHKVPHTVTFVERLPDGPGGKRRLTPA
jgi:long-chain acyl-CoA synthetase